MDTMSVNGKDFTVIKLLGKGKGGYSYLVSDGEHNYVLKQIHHEPCSYYTFGNKIQSELNDYKRLKNAGLRLPKLIDCDVENERILKDYIDGKTAYELVLQNEETHFHYSKSIPLRQNEIQKQTEFKQTRRDGK